MRKNLVVVSILLACSSLAHSEVSSKSMFNCLDMQNLEVDNQCTSSLIMNNIQFKNMQSDFTQKLEEQGNAMATTLFFPDKMLIKVIAQKEQDLTYEKLLASVN